MRIYVEKKKKEIKKGLFFSGKAGFLVVSLIMKE